MWGLGAPFYSLCVGGLSEARPPEGRRHGSAKSRTGIPLHPPPDAHEDLRERYTRLSRDWADARATLWPFQRHMGSKTQLAPAFVTSKLLPQMFGRGPGQDSSPPNVMTRATA